MLRRRRRGSGEDRERVQAPTAEPTCQAPHAMLRFTPDGRVLVCCANDQHALGVVGQDSIREIWDGDERARIAAALDALDYSLGCDECGAERAIGNRPRSIEAMWDRYADDPGPHAWPRRMEFALSNTCNLQCIQCNGDRSSAIRAQREHRPPMPIPYGDAFFEELRDFLPHLEDATFAGGEPFLARETRRVMDMLIELDSPPKVDVVTNATVWDDRVEAYLRALRMDVTLSIDGATPETIEAVRVGADYDEVWANCDRFIETVRSYGGTVSFNYCFMPQNWHELGDLLLRADGLDVSVDVLPVTFPVRFNVLNMAEDDLRAAVHEMEAQDARIGARLGRNSAVWEAKVALLRRHLDLRESDGVPVELTAREPTPVSPDLLESLLGELRAWSGQEPLLVRLVGGKVTEVDAPEWAAPFDAQRWVGWPNEVLLSDIVDRVGLLRDFDAEPVSTGVQMTSFAIVVDGERVPFRSVMTDGCLLAATPVALDRLVARRHEAVEPSSTGA